MNIETFTNIAHPAYKDDPAGKKKMGEAVFKEIFNHMDKQLQMNSQNQMQMLTQLD